MVALKLTTLALVAFQAFQAVGLKADEVQELEEELDDPTKQQSPALKVEVSTSFPQSEIFGVKLVNGHATQAVLDVSNNEPESIHVILVGGSLSSPVGVAGAPDPPVILRNLTSQTFGLEIPAGEKQSVAYSFTTEMHPQDLQLNIAAVIQSSAGRTYTNTVYNETVSIVEAPLSIFDPQIVFLYLFLAAAFGGVCFFIYQTWITRLFPQKRRGGKGGERAKRSSGQTKKVDPSDQVSVIGADGPAVTSGAKAYDESWIPAEHLKRPEAKRVGSGRPKSRAA